MHQVRERGLRTHSWQRSYAALHGLLRTVFAAARAVGLLTLLALCGAYALAWLVASTAAAVALTFVALHFPIGKGGLVVAIAATVVGMVRSAAKARRKRTEPPPVTQLALSDIPWCGTALIMQRQRELRQQSNAPQRDLFGSFTPPSGPQAPTPVELPTVHRTTPIIARRAWRIRMSCAGAVLGSVTKRGLWPHRTLTATCVRRPLFGLPSSPLPAHRVPDPACTCGIYSVPEGSEPSRFREYLWAEGRIALTGRVIEGTHGYRAELATVLDLRLGVRCAVGEHRGKDGKPRITSGAHCAGVRRSPVIPEWTVVSDGTLTPLCEEHVEHFERDDLQLSRRTRVAARRLGFDDPPDPEMRLEFTADLMHGIAADLETRYQVPVTF